MKVRLTAFVGAVLLWPGLVVAQSGSEQTANSSRGLVIENIVVTAQRREEGMNDVSVAITAYTREQLAALGVNDTRDLGQLVPGFTFADGGFNTPIYTLRGVGFNENSQTASATVGVYIDEFNLPFPVMTRGPAVDIERVEVLKGPQGTLYGRNTTGGAINFIAAKPQAEFGYGASVGYSRFDTTDMSAWVTGSITGSLRARIALRDMQAGEGWQQSRTRHDGSDAYNGNTGRDIGGAYGRFGNDTMGEVDKQSGRLMLDWDASESLQLSGHIAGWRDRSDPQALQLIGLDPRSSPPDPQFHPDVASYPFNDPDTDDNRAADWPNDGTEFRLNDRFVSGGVRLDWQFSDSVELAVLASSGKFEADGSFTPQSGFDVSNMERNIFATTDFYNIEARLSGRWRELLFWQLGANYSEDDVEEFQRLNHETVSIVFPMDSDPGDGTAGLDNRSGFEGNQLAEVEAIFLHTEWQLSELFKLTAALRYTDELRSFDGCSRDVDVGTEPGADQEPPGATDEGVGLDNAFTGISATQSPMAGYSPGSVESGGCFTLDNETRRPGRFFGELHEDNVSGRLAVDWTPNEDWLVFLSWSRGFKSGSFPLINISDSIQYTPAVQEQLDALEAGVKWTFAERRGQLNASAFDYRYLDKQLLTNFRDPIFGPLPILRNAPKSNVRGAELDLKLTPVNGLYIALAASYLDSEVEEFVSGDINGDDFDFSGKPFNYTPQWEYTLAVNYALPLFDRFELSAGIDYRYTDETNATLERNPLFAIDDYALVNAQLMLTPLAGPWSVRIWGRNITDEYYVTNVTNQIDSLGRYTGMPQVWGVTFAWQSDR